MIAADGIVAAARNGNAAGLEAVREAELSEEKVGDEASDEKAGGAQITVGMKKRSKELEEDAAAELQKTAVVVVVAAVGAAQKPAPGIGMQGKTPPARRMAVTDGRASGSGELSEDEEEEGAAWGCWAGWVKWLRLFP